MTQRVSGTWAQTTEFSGLRYTCGHCGADVGPSRRHQKDQGEGSPFAQVAICTVCNRPTYLCDSLNEQVPGPLVGRSIARITDPEVEELYDEARRALASGAPSASVLVSRKLLMHVAVGKGAKTNQGFTYYADFLSTEGIVGKPFANVVTHI